MYVSEGTVYVGGNHEVHRYLSPFSLQHNIRAPWLKAAESNTFHHPRDDEISNSMGNCNASIPDGLGIQVQKSWEETGEQAIRKGKAAGENRPNGGDAYKGYHQVQMAKEDEEKTTFNTDQGTFCYTKMSFGLKNARAMYQSKLIADVAETFDNLRRINMKLNPKKCSFGVEEGKLLGYLVTSEGIRANPAKTKDIAEMQSPKT
ncbi:hypothetical protein Tco_0821495 [Tanacetum coccineum]|uniref:Reverse transcriptase Ty1/copia-type domain-containing protein n=1 Tax=Tanacetum coccineum TaxID=301880 RepID=A0ABQ5ADA5_9ASTR